jgi:hypothetical protein
VVGARVGNVLRGSKDIALGYAARTFINSRLRGIGEASQLSIDTKKRAIRLRMQLAGDATPFEIHVRKYAVERRGGGATLTIADATATRQWVAIALRDFIIGRRFTIPAQAAAALKLLT